MLDWPDNYSDDFNYKKKLNEERFYYDSSQDDSSGYYSSGDEYLYTDYTWVNELE